MVSALYRRYRPETFSELIGQSHVTDPLMVALRSDRVNHAYLFSGPRGCGKTTSARILARCLNCANGPTDTPCGECASCIELGREGGGSIDVIEIDAASHGGVDDARDLRERATLAPNRDRYKIYIIDEAHMVSKDGFNALLKIVEEPPEHVKFIFATTEPEKVIGTIRSRTHHYPFRLIPPALLLEYVTDLSRQEGVEVDPGVLPLVIRAGGGSARDTLSLLDQLMAGSEGAVTYERAVSLLGFTHAELLDDVTVALAAKDAQGAFNAVERVMQTGQDPRRFVEDLLEHLRDLIIAAVTEDAEAILHGVQVEEIERMRDRAHDFGPVALSHAADTVAKSLSSMSGATSPKLQLELLLARLLVTGDNAPAPQPREPRTTVSAHPAQANRMAAGAGPADTAKSDSGGADVRADSSDTTDSAGVQPPSAPQDRRAESAPAPQAKSGAPDSRPDLAAAAASFRASAPSAPAPTSGAPSAPPSATAANSPEPSTHTEGAPEPMTEDPAPPVSSIPDTPEASASAPETVSEPQVDDGQAATEEPAPEQDDPAGAVSFEQLEDAWPEVLGVLEGRSRRAWMVASAIRPVDYDTDSKKIGLAFRSQGDMQEFRAGKDGGEMIWKIIRVALTQRFGQEFGFTPRDTGFAPTANVQPAEQEERPASSESNDEPGGMPSPASEYGSYEPPESYPEPALPEEDIYAESAPSREGPETSSVTPQRSASASPPRSSSSASSVSGGWAVAQIPQSDPADDTAVPDPWAEATPNATVTVDERHDSRGRETKNSKLPAALQDVPPAPEPKELSATESARYGEAVIREELGAEFIEEITDNGGF